MRSRFIGGLAAIAVIAGAATLSTVNHARAADVAAAKEVIQVSEPAPLALAPVVVSQLATLVPVTLDRTRPGRVGVVLCVVAERASDSVAAVNDSLLGRLRVIVPRRYESLIVPPASGSGRLRPRSSASRDAVPDSSRPLHASRSLRSSS